MIVDMLLRVMGENPSQYTQSIDKRVAVFGLIMEKILFILPFIFFLIPWVWFLYKYKKGKDVGKKRIIITIIISIILMLIGFYLSDWYDYLVAIIGIRSYYGM